MGKPPAYDPVAETEYLVQVARGRRRGGRHAATRRVHLRRRGRTACRWASGVRGPRALNFAPLLVLEEYALNDLLKALLTLCQEALGAPVEIEFAVTFPPEGEDGPARFGFLQVRPMSVSDTVVDIDLQSTRPQRRCSSPRSG